MIKKKNKLVTRGAGIRGGGRGEKLIGSKLVTTPIRKINRKIGNAVYKLGGGFNKKIKP